MRVIEDKALKPSLRQQLESLYPDTFRAIHRVVLTLRGKSYVLNGFLTIDRKNRAVTLLAQNDMGGMVFDVHSQGERSPVIHTYLPGIRPEWLEQNMVRDLKMLYFLKMPAISELYREAESNTVVRHILCSRDCSGQTQEMVFTSSQDNTPCQLTEIRRFKNQHPIYSIRFNYDEDSCEIRPNSALIADTNMNYSLKINIRYMMPKASKELP